MSGPATSAGLDASTRRRAMLAMLAPSGRPAPPLTARVVWWRTSSSERTSAYQSSIGIDTNTGPRGGRAAVCSARASACGTSCAQGGS